MAKFFKNVTLYLWSISERFKENICKPHRSEAILEPAFLREPLCLRDTSWHLLIEVLATKL